MSDSNQVAQPAGEPDKRSRDEWLLLALLLADDFDAARLMWEDHAPRAYRGLLTGDGFTFDAERQLFIHNGKAVPADVLKRESLNLAHRIGMEMRQDGILVAQGKQPIDVFEHRMVDAVKDIQLVQGALGAGGFDRLKQYLPRVIGAAEDGTRPEGAEGEAQPGSGVAFSLDRLRDFAQQIKDGDVRAGTENAIASRAEMYAEASVPVYEDVRRQSHIDATDGRGRKLFLFERSIINSSDPCTSRGDAMGCVAVAAAGWQPIGSLPEIGTRSCTFRCQCTWEFSDIGPASEN